MSAPVLTSNYSEAPFHTICATSSLLLSTAETQIQIPSSSHIPDSISFPDLAGKASTSSGHEMSDIPSRKRQRVDKSGLSSVLTSSSVRRSERRKEKHQPLGPRHLEYDYHQAYEELRAATIRAVYEMGYKPTKRSLNGPSTRSKSNASAFTKLPTVAEITATGFPYVIQARRKLDQADRLLQEALSNGQYWDNTPVPAFIGTLDSPPSAPSFLPPLRDNDTSTDSSLSTCSSVSSRSASRQPSVGITPPTTVASTPEPETAEDLVKPPPRKRRRED